MVSLPNQYRSDTYCICVFDYNSAPTEAVQFSVESVFTIHKTQGMYDSREVKVTQESLSEAMTT